MSERWLPVVGFEQIYEVSSLGRVRSKARRQTDSLGRLGRCNGGKVLSPERTKLGYLRIRMSDGVKMARVLVHRLVADAFLPVPTFSPCEINHINGHKGDNAAANLEWSTRAGNMAHAIRTGLKNPNALRGVGRVLRPDQAVAIYGDKRTLKEVASDYGIAVSTVSAIRTGQIWASVTGACQ